jgi:hypothetical protein
VFAHYFRDSFPATRNERDLRATIPEFLDQRQSKPRRAACNGYSQAVKLATQVVF